MELLVMLNRTEQSRSHAGPSLVALAIVYTLLIVASIISGALLKHGAPVVNPYSPAEEARRFFADNPESIRVSMFFLFGSSVPLGIYAATVISRLRFLGVRAAGSYIALFGGFAASVALAASSVCGWVLSIPEVSASLVATRVLHFMTLLFGGLCFAVAFGLLAAGVSVTTYVFRVLPRWLVWFGILVAAAGELASFSLLTLPASVLIPVVRFTGFVWLIAVGLALPKSAPPSESSIPRTSADRAAPQAEAA
jgi:hypothetical protein